MKRDYSLLGASNTAAVTAGLANAAWFTPAIPSAKLRLLQERSDGHALFDTVLWLVVLFGLAAAIWQTAWSWWSIPLLFVYGAIYDGATSSRLHECLHGTAFRTTWLNDALANLAGFMLLSSPTLSRWSHFRHHTDTIIVGRDLEIRVHRPATVAKTLWILTALPSAPLKVLTLIRHACNRIDPLTAELVPSSERRRVVIESRVIVLLHGGVIGWCVASGSILPVVLIGLPAIYGGWMTVFFSMLQHTGLCEDVTDHRLNSRTIYMSPVWRFIYVNMNYHIEHHMFPTVPYRSLPALHAEIRDQLPAPLPNVWAAVRQIVAIIRRQRREPEYELPITLPKVRRATRHRFGSEFSKPPARLADGSYDCGALEELLVGELREFSVDGHVYVLGRLDATRVVLADGLCTHQHAHLADGALVDECFECPKHNARFDARSGACRRAPAQIVLAVYDVLIRNGRIITSLRPRPDCAATGHRP